jgi:hypothetical protein
MYVNGETSIDSVALSVLTNTFSQGRIGLLADDEGDPATVLYTNALVWTM